MAINPKRTVSDSKPVVRTVIHKITAPKITQQSSEGLRRALFDQLDMLRNGQTTPTVANATSRLAEAIVSTVELEMQIEGMAHRLGKQGHKLINILPPSVPLGNRNDAAEVEISEAFHQDEENNSVDDE